MITLQQSVTLVRLLQEGGATRGALAAACGVHVRHLDRLLKELEPFGVRIHKTESRPRVLTLIDSGVFDARIRK